MGDATYITDEVEVRAAATLLGGGATADTSAVDIRGAKCVFFLVRATNAQPLAAGTSIQVSMDGTNFVSVSSPIGVVQGANAIIGVAFNAGPRLAHAWPIVKDDGGAALSLSAGFTWIQARLHLVSSGGSPANDITGLSVAVCVVRGG